MHPFKPLLTASLLWLSAAAGAAALHDYAPDGAAAWKQKLNALKQGGETKFRIIQVGDSHTAGGFFTDQLRQILQQQWGDGGIGWVFPNQIKGQRTAIVRYQGAWPVQTSRKDRADFPFGGVLARSNRNETLTLLPTRLENGIQNITLTVRPVLNNGALNVRTGEGNITPLFALHGNTWQYFDLQGSLPLSLQAGADELWELGPVNIENGQRGVTVSALGINGSQLGHWQNWRSNWADDLAATRADLIILAYGTNEAFNGQLDLTAAAQRWRDTVRRIRNALPEAAVLIVGAPESLTRTGGACGSRPPRLDGVQQMQQQVAQSEGTLYWSWQEAMGGACSMNNWVKQKYAAADGVHFSAEGYRRTAARLAQALLDFPTE